MRIISGTYRGKTITPPAGFNSRPTTDFAKESLFNILANRYDFSCIHALDLFAGTGSIGIELASRGCPHIEAVEMKAGHAAFIKKTAAELDFRQLHVVRLNVFDFLEICTAEYDLIFADPPFSMVGVETLPQRITGLNILKSGGCFVLEHAAHYDFAAVPYFTERRRYGNVHFSFFVKP
ncbi:MAG: RsmD family RNA methyltransferase [Prevotellaceae bacterium]|jgi:16S rRNA (guanine(966)-N(2))-methyltransferase RsmD|nr:RsmD family RNA methyltransferase [Prevotellaceae bacterium]